MTDFEINKRLAELLGEFEDPKDSPTEVIGDKLCFCNDSGYIIDCHKDYCDSWADMGEIIVELGISLIKDEFSEKWLAVMSHNKQSTNENPLRAAALVAIKVLEDRL